MNARAIDPDDIFTGEVRSIQDAYPEAHLALTDWGAWSNRYVKPVVSRRVTRPMIYDLGPPVNPEDYTDDRDLQRVEIREQKEVQAEAPKAQPFNERLAVEIDIRIHKDNFPRIWRRCLRTAYVWSFPEFQWPDRTGCGDQGFIMFFDAALARIQKAME